jgi:hypothetical protein
LNGQLLAVGNALRTAENWTAGGSQEGSARPLMLPAHRIVDARGGVAERFVVHRRYLVRFWFRAASASTDHERRVAGRLARAPGVTVSECQHRSDGALDGVLEHRQARTVEMRPLEPCRSHRAIYHATSPETADG